VYLIHTGSCVRREESAASIASPHSIQYGDKCCVVWDEMVGVFNKGKWGKRSRQFSRFREEVASELSLEIWVDIPLWNKE